MVAADLAPAVALSTEIPEPQVRAVLRLLGEGGTIPFIARYRKEATGSLDEVKLRAIESSHRSCLDLEERRTSVRAAIDKQGKLTPELNQAIEAARTKTVLEDLYAPYKKRKTTRADKARSLGLEPLAERIWTQPHQGAPLEEAASFLREEVTTKEAALEGAVDIVAERIAERADIRSKLRMMYVREGKLVSKLTRGVDPNESKYRDWDNFEQLARQLPSHRYLAIDRGEREKELRVKIEVPTEIALQNLRAMTSLRSQSPFAPYLEDALNSAFTRLLAPSLERELRAELKTRADEKAVEVFASNLKNLLLAPPFGAQPVLGIDPGLRTGAKCALVSATGALVEHGTAHIIRGEKDKNLAEKMLIKMVAQHKPTAIAVGNGTGGRETEAFLQDLARQHSWTIPIVTISESGASVYSASDVAREELPDVDLTVRGAVSIARRLQDPLAELVKIDPAAIGVGQYQHDIKPARLADALAAVIEDCVHHVGVDLETASPSLLSRVSGISRTVAQTIVAYRIREGGFKTRQELLKVKGLGKKAFEQAAGFLRIKGNNPLDASAVHPERYELVAQIARDLGLKLTELVGHPEKAKTIPINNYVNTNVGLPTLRDIQDELGRPGRDPREQFEAPTFREDVHSIDDLQEGMELNGVITNVTSFGAFVDIGVHQDGLVHISELSQNWVSNPEDVVSVGQKVRVRVLTVDLARRRIGLSCKI